MNNDPIMMFNLDLRPIGKIYEREVYSVTEMLGNVGGILEILKGLAAAIIYIICSTKIDTNFISVFKDPNYNSSNNEISTIN